MPYHAGQLPASKGVILFAPHPDDEVFGAGGLIYLYRQAGVSVNVHVLTDGSLGGDSPGIEFIETREAESRSAATLLGVNNIDFWRLPDRGLEYGEALIARLLAVLESTQSDVVVAPALSEIHPDHRFLAMAVVEAIRRCRRQITLLMYEVGSPIPNPDLLIDISAARLPKRQAMACFGSQTNRQNYIAQIEALNTYRTYTLPMAVAAAEAYRCWVSDGAPHSWRSLYEHAALHQRQQGIPTDPSIDIPLVSILIRSMGRELLARALDSIALQTYPNIEVVIVNALGDNHPAVAVRCGRFPLHLVACAGHETATPRALSRPQAANVALESAQGEWLMFLDDDDTIEPDHIHKLVTAVINTPAALAANTGIACIDSSDALNGPVFDCEVDAVLLASGNQLPIHSVLFSHHLLTQGCRFDESLLTYEDWDFWIQVSCHTAFRYVPGISGHYYLIGNSGVHHRQTDLDLREEIVFKKWSSRRTEQFDKDTAHWIKIAHQRQLECQHQLEALKDAGTNLAALQNEFDDYKNNPERQTKSEPEVAHDPANERSSKGLSIRQMEEDLTHKLEVIARLESELAERESSLTKTRDSLLASTRELQLVYASRSWKILCAARKLLNLFRRASRHPTNQ